MASKWKEYGGKKRSSSPHEDAKLAQNRPSCTHYHSIILLAVSLSLSLSSLLSFHPSSFFPSFFFFSNSLSLSHPSSDTLQFFIHIFPYFAYLSFLRLRSLNSLSLSLSLFNDSCLCLSNSPTRSVPCPFLPLPFLLHDPFCSLSLIIPADVRISHCSHFLLPLPVSIAFLS